MAKIIVYNVSSQALEVFYRGESDNMPYAYGNTMKVREFRGSSSSSVLWTSNATMESWNATRRSFNAPIPFRYAFKRIWEGGHGQQSQHYAGSVRLRAGLEQQRAQPPVADRQQPRGLELCGAPEPDADLGPCRQTIWLPCLQRRLSDPEKRKPRRICPRASGCAQRLGIFHTDAGWRIWQQYAQCPAFFPAQQWPQRGWHLRMLQLAQAGQRSGRHRKDADRDRSLNAYSSIFIDFSENIL